MELVLDPAARLQHALDLAYRYLGHRDRTVLEIRRYLEARRVEPAMVDQAVAALSEQGYLDDARFALRFAEDRRRLDHWGRDRIERRLLACGIDRELVAETLDDVRRDDELERAIEVLRRRYADPPTDRGDARRAYGVLVRKGFDPELAADAVRAYAREPR